MCISGLLYHLLVLLTVFWYVEYHFVLVEKTKSAKNIWEPVIENQYIIYIQNIQIYIFIALIHPIQWTIALLVGATGPAKCKKKMSCI